jgi:hypothetical protein
MAIGYLVSRSQRASFEEKGYLIIKDALSVSEISALKTWVQQVHDLPRTQECRYIPYEEVNKFNERVLCRTENFVDDHAEFGALLRGSEMLGILEQLSGVEMVLFKEKSWADYVESGSDELLTKEM